MNPSEPCVILIEFNELCPQLMDKFIDQQKLPNFARFRSESEVFVTDAEAEGEELNPWVQWVTVHTGLPHQEHQVLHLSQGHKLETKAIWDTLSDEGFRVWVCSSMNPRADLPLNGFLLPDPWSTGVRPQPENEFDPFFDYVRSAVQEHTGSQSNVNSKQFLRYMLTHGMSFRTMFNTAYQLFSERFRDVKWKRVGIMDQLQFDLFRHYFRKHQPNFSTFFANSTAHLQHSYWRHMEPEAFSLAPDDKELQTYGGAIEFGYRTMDKLIGKFLRLAPPHATLIFCTALSQQPYVDFDTTGGRRYYHLHRPQDLKNVLGVPQEFTYEPVMSTQFLLRFNSDEEMAAAEDYLTSLRLSESDAFRTGNPQLIHVVRADDLSLMCQCCATGTVSPDAMISGGSLEKAIPFKDLFYQLSEIKSARHHPDGMLWVRHPNKTHVVHEEKLSLLKIAPMILDMFNVDSKKQDAELVEAASLA